MKLICTMQLLLLMSIENHNRILIISSHFILIRVVQNANYKKKGLFWQNNVLLLLFLSLFGEPILTTACFYLCIARVLNIYCIYQWKMYLWKHKRKILFVVTRLELSVSFTEELSVAEFSGSHFQYAPKWQRTVKMKLFLKLCGIQENLVPFKNANLYLLESERLAKCCFDKNLIDGTTIEKINMKKCACFLF